MTMNGGTYTKEEAEAARIVGRIPDAPAEAKRRWPDFHFEVKKEGGRSLVVALWTRNGKKRGFKDPLPARYTVEDVRHALENCATAALLKAEYDRLTGTR